MRATRELARALVDVHISMTMVGDGAGPAPSGAPPTTAYIAAHVALRFDGPASYAAERERQSSWLVERLALRVTDRLPS